MNKFDVKSQAVLMCGISGSGKTRYARRLEEEGYIRLSIDSLIWEKVGVKLFRLSKEEQKRLFGECRKQICDKLTELLKSGEKVVVDATHCRRSVRDEMRKLCAKVDVIPIFLYCYADEEKLWTRLSQRKGRGPDDLIVNREALSEYWHGFEPPQEDESDFIFVE